MCVCVVVSENVCGCVFGCEWWVSVRAHVRSSRWRLGQGDPAGAGTHGGPWRVSFGLCDLPLSDLPVELFSFYLCLPSHPVSLFRHHAPVRCLGALLGAESAGRTGRSSRWARLQAGGSQVGKEAVVQGSRERTSLGSRTECQRGGHRV